MKELDLKKNLKQLEKRLALIYAGSLVVLCGLAVFSNQILKEQAAAQATSFIRRMVKLGDIRETIITLSQAKLDYFDAVVYSDNLGTRVFSLPVDLDLKVVNQDRAANVLKYGYVNTRIYFDQNARSPLGTLVFAYSRYEYVKYAFGFWLLLVFTTLPLMAGARRSVVRRYDADLKIRAELARADLARTVRHDIRSPLISLQGFLSSTEHLSPIERRVLDRIVARIFGIIADLEDSPGKEATQQSDLVPVADVIREVVREKQLQLKKSIQIECHFEPSAFLAYSSMTKVQLERLVSNILDNSVDAISSRGKIEISLRVALGSTMLKISDTGKGIPSDVLPRIFEKNFFYDKPKGTGIGLSSAKEVVEACDGKIAAASTLGAGTTIEIELPIRNQPAWWMDRIETADVARIVVVDDQETSHDAWRMKLRGVKECDHLMGEVDFEQWLAANKVDGALFLVDFDLGPKSKNGIDLVKKFNVASRSILVTGNFDDPNIRAQCQSLKLKLLPKPLIDAIAVV